MDGQEANKGKHNARASGNMSRSLIRGAARAISERWERARDAAAAAEVPYRAATAFTDLPVYQAMRRHRDIANMLGIANPFYRSHDGRSGATTLIGGKEYLNFASYDYCGLNQHAAVGEAAKAAIDRYGTSVSASRIVAGERPLHRALEVALAEFYGVEDAVAFVSGHATNVSTIGVLMGADDLILHDEFMHNSAIVGARLSRATCVSFRHNNLDALEEALKANRAKHRNALIVVEGLYSMDGDFPDLPRLIEIKRRYGAWLMVDEAHALGVLGATGRGIAEHFDADPHDVDIWMGTLSKTLGACGGYIAGKRELIEIMKFQAPGFVYSVGLSPPITAAALAALELLKAQPERVARLQANGKLFLAEANAAGLDTGTSAGYAVVPVIVGDTIKVVKLTERLLARGVNALPIFYPAVPMKAARVRYFITSEHTPEQIRTAVAITRDELASLSKQGLALERAVVRMVAR
ncbi:MAG TPA: aminotransferase class I/II-fold pyridoxal phosphate-dependent enzyme [Hyphomicrobiaceae bacterium]|nr:aminotransferase class I/II-fold pyridoxal phosphate-dependent enzyme [Hyphomicrobiaceae bacterium]